MTSRPDSGAALTRRGGTGRRLGFRGLYVIGRQISHFYIIRALGAGGMGVVYEAQDTRLPRSVAIKVLKEEASRDVDAVRRFKREARLASSLNHPNICTVFEVNEGDLQAFIAMELLDGASLKARLLGGALSLAEIVDIASQVADALGAAHEQAIVHRDITPGNIFLTRGGVVKLLDFGLARHFTTAGSEGDATDDLTHSGSAVGTIHYMSPEQLEGRGVADSRSDLYALGAVLYQMATGARPFDIHSRQALIAAIQRQPHIPVRELAPRHPVHLQRIIDRLLTKRADDRYQSAAALRADLDVLRRSVDTAPVGAARSGSVALAVVPFEVVGDKDAAVLALRDGLAADLMSHLSRQAELSVASRTSTAALTSHPVRQIGRELGVELVLEGTLQRSAGRVHVTASLIDAALETTVGPALVVDRPDGDPLTTQDEVAQLLCDGVASALSRAPARRHSQDPTAYHAFKRGQHLWRTCFEGGWRPAIEYFQQAIERDPQFALAHVALASAYNFMGFYALIKPGLAFAVAGRAAEHALAIDPRLGSAFIEAAVAKFGGNWDWEGAEEAFRRGLALDAANPLAHVYYSWLLMLLGREDAAHAEALRGQDLAPSSRFVAAARAQTLYMAGRYSDAIELCSECLRFDPTYVFALHMRGLCHLVMSARDGALADLSQAVSLSHRAPFYVGLLGRCYAEFGMREDAFGLVAELEAHTPDTYVPPQCFVYIYAALGESARALAFQEKAYVDGASPFNYLFPGIRRLYALSPHHKRRLEQMRLVV